ncbi:MAG: TIR domain-containing protein [bacterium]
MDPEFSFDVFLSHSSKDKKVVHPLAERLRKDGLRVWLDEWEIHPGDSIPAKLDDGLEHSRMLVLCLSANAFGADWAKFEANTFRVRDPLNRERRLIFLRLDDAPIEGSLAQFRYINWQATKRAQSYPELLAALRWRKYWEDYAGLFALGEYRIAFMPLMNDCRTNEVQSLRINDVDIDRDMGVLYQLPAAFRKTERLGAFTDDPCCRLVSFDFQKQRKLRLTFSETSYADYLKSGEHLDAPCPGKHGRTFREEFANLVADGPHDLRRLDLTNITRVGVFIITRDNRVIVSRHSDRSHIYPGRWTFSACGVVKWGAHPHPFLEVMRKSFEEIHHQMTLRGLQLNGFGADARKLFFQISFVEETSEESQNVIDRSPSGHDVISIHLESAEIVRHLVDRCWEPAAEAALLTLCVQKFGRESVISELNAAELDWRRKEMLDEWDFRAGQPGLLPVMSLRYSPVQREKYSGSYVKAVLRFLGSDISGKHVLEVGCGIGRITAPLLSKARTVTSIDLCERMIERARELVVGCGQKTKRLEFKRCFIQELDTRRKYDVAVCSLVLIHNVEDAQFKSAVEKMCRCAETVYVFEDVTRGRTTSPHARFRSKEDLEQEFKLNGFVLKKNRPYKLFRDDIVFLKFNRLEQQKKCSRCKNGEFNRRR